MHVIVCNSLPQNILHWHLFVFSSVFVSVYMYLYLYLFTMKCTETFASDHSSNPNSWAPNIAICLLLHLFIIHQHLLMLITKKSPLFQKNMTFEWKPYWKVTFSCLQENPNANCYLNIYALWANFTAASPTGRIKWGASVCLLMTTIPGHNFLLLWSLTRCGKGFHSRAVEKTQRGKAKQCSQLLVAGEWQPFQVTIGCCVSLRQDGAAVVQCLLLCRL